jgi:arsenite methyltransferase
MSTTQDHVKDYYGQIATYHSTIPHAPHGFTLDECRTFVTHKPAPVSGNTAAMLTDTRYSDHFHVQGDRARHYGPFRVTG